MAATDTWRSALLHADDPTDAPVLQHPLEPVVHRRDMRTEFGLYRANQDLDNKSLITGK